LRFNAKPYGQGTVIRGDSKLLSGFPWPIIFKPGNNKEKLHTEYENLTQIVLLSIKSILQNAKQLQSKQFYFVVFGLKIIGHGNPDSVLETHSIF
jgi:hypothetical protein